MFFAKTDNSAGTATISADSLQDQLAGQLMGLFDKVVTDQGKHYVENPSDIPTKGDIEGRINRYALQNASITAGASFVPGPLGMLAAIPEIMLVTYYQIVMIYDISVAYGHQKHLNKELLAGVLGSALGASTLGLVVFHGQKILIKRASLRMMQKLAQIFASKISQRLLKSMVGKWVPFAGAAALGAWSGYSTRQIGKQATEMLKKEIEFDNDVVDEQQSAEEMDRIPNSSNSQDSLDLEILKVQSLINLMLVDGEITDEEEEYMELLIDKANINYQEKLVLLESMKSGSKFNTDYSGLKNSPDDAVSLLMDLVGLAKRDGKFHVTEKLYVKQVGRVLGFSGEDIEEIMATT